MNREDIIRMAREAGLVPKWLELCPKDEKALVRFFAIAAEHEREECAKVCDDKAKETFSGQCQVWGDYFARAIRARSNT